MRPGRGEGGPRALFGDAALLVPYTDPGYRLAKLMEDELCRVPQDATAALPHVVLMQNHGLVVAADTTAEIRGLTDDVLCGRSAGSSAQPLPSSELPVSDAAARLVPALRMLLSEGEAAKVAAVRNSSLVRAFPAAREQGRDLPSLHAGRHRLLQVRAPVPGFQKRSRGGARGAFPAKLEELPRALGLSAQDAHGGRASAAWPWRTRKRSVETCLDVFEDLMKVSWLCESFGGPRFLSGP